MMAQFLTFFKGIEALESFMKACSGAAKEWTVGISHDAVGRLEQHGQKNNPYAAAADFGDEATARLVEKYFLQTGMKGDAGGGDPQKPPTQVYVFRVPKV